MKRRVAVGGFLHETNTFSPIPTELRHFEQADYWPALQRGAPLIAAVSGLNISIAGAIETLRSANVEIVPTVWCSAPPGGKVTTEAFETIVGWLCEDLAGSGELDGVVLELHGAMVSEAHDDAERFIVERVRAVVGDIPIAVTLDLHANVSDEFVNEVDIMDAYQTYPHVDIAQTGERVAHALLKMFESGSTLHKSSRRLDFLIPLPWQCTDIEPLRGIYDFVRSKIGGDVRSLSFTPGFNASDVPMCGPVVFGYGSSAAAIESAVQDVYDRLCHLEGAFAGKLYSAAEAVATAIAEYDGYRPIVIADCADNPGGGGTGDTTDILRELVSQSACGSVVGILCDPRAAAAAHNSGCGATLRLQLGGSVDGRPFDGEFRVEYLGSGSFKCVDPMFFGVTMDLGAMALLSIAGVRVAICSKSAQAADRAMFQHLQVEPSTVNILVVKSAVHFRAAFAPLAGAILNAAASGLAPVDTRLIPFRKLPAHMRVTPSAFPQDGE